MNEYITDMKKSVPEKNYLGTALSEHPKDHPFIKYTSENARKYFDARVSGQRLMCDICYFKPRIRDGMEPRKWFGIHPDQRLVVDHCHQSGFIRGLLCLTCNNLLGHAYDDFCILQQATEYIQTYRLWYLEMAEFKRSRGKDIPRLKESTKGDWPYPE